MDLLSSLSSSLITRRFLCFFLTFWSSTGSVGAGAGVCAGAGACAGASAMDGAGSCAGGCVAAADSAVAAAAAVCDAGLGTAGRKDVVAAV